MNLESDKRLNIQLRLDFSSAPTGEARQAGREDIESLSVVSEPERPANTSRILEAVCERANPGFARGDRRITLWLKRSSTSRTVTHGCSTSIWKSSLSETITGNGGFGSS